MKFLQLSVLAAATAFSLSTMAQEIVINNNCGFTISQLALFDEAAQSGEDLTGGNGLAAGASLTIELSGEAANGWRLIAVDDEGTQIDFPNFDMSGVSQITLNADGTANYQ